MAVKFSQFDGTITPVKTSETQFIVGFEGTTNVKWTMKALADEIGGDTIFTTSPTSTVPTGQVIKLTDTIQFQGPTTAYPGFVFKPATTASGAFGEFKVDGRVFLKNYAANDGWAFGGTNTTNSFHFNTGTGTMSDGWSMRVHGGTNTNGALIIKGAGLTGSTTALKVQNSDGEDVFTVRDDKYTIVNINNGIENAFLIKNEATWTMLDAGDDGLNSAQMRMYDNNNVRFYFKASQGLMVADTGNNGSSGASSVLTATSNTRGFLPPRNADPASNITTPVAGLMAYDTTDNELQFYNGTSWNSAGGGGGDNIYTVDGTIGASRVATITDFPKFSGTQPNPIGLELENTQTGSGAMSTLGAQLKMTSNSATGTIGYFNSGSGGSNAPAMVLDSPGRIVYTAAVDAGHMFQLAHGDFRFLNDAGQNYPIFESIVAGGGSNYSEFRLAKTGNTYSYIRSVQNDANNIFSVGRTVSGTYGEAIRINQANQLGINSDGMTIGAQLHVKGAGATNATTSLLVENSNGDYMMSVKDDGQITIGSGATIQSTSNPQYSVVMGYGAKDITPAGSAAESVAIGRLAAGNGGSVAIGGQAKCLGVSAVAIGAQAQAAATGTSIGLQAGGASAGSSAVSIGKFAQAKATGSIAIGTNTGLTGDNSIVLNATTGVTASTADDTFEIFMTSTSTPDFTIKGTSGGNQAKFVGQVSVGVGSGSNATIDFDTGNMQEITIPTETATNFTPTNAVAGSTYIIKITQAGTSGTMNWESSATVNWPGGTAPTLTATSAGVDIITLVCTVGGATGGTFYGTSALNFS